MTSFLQVALEKENKKGEEGIQNRQVTASFLIWNTPGSKF